MLRAIALILGCGLLPLYYSQAGEADAETIFKQGVSKLREAQTDHSALVPATKLLIQAAAMFEKAGDEAKVTEINSCLYWAKKKFTLADTTVVKGSADVSAQLDAATKEVPADQAQVYLDKANAYAKSHADDALLVAVRYFEVGDRFKDTAPGREAIDLSLKAMQRIGEKAKLEAYKPAPTDGKVFVKSEPAGAAILFITADGGKLDTGKVTPTLIQLPVGFQSVELTIKAYKSALLTVQVDGKSIAKPESVKLVALTVPLDVVFEEGWSVFVNGAPARNVDGGKSETPCTIELPLGGHQIVLAKDGFIDISQRVEIKSLEDKVTLEPRTKPSKGASNLLKTAKAPVGNVKSPLEQAILGKWDVRWRNSSGSGMQKVEFLKDGVARYSDGTGESEGTWKIEDGVILYKTPRSLSKLKLTSADKLEGTSDDGGTRSATRR